MRPGERTLRLLLQPIQPYLNDPAVTDICINTQGEVWVERMGVWSCHQVPYTFKTLDSIATLAAAMSSQDVGPDKPLCATVLPDGQRVQICRPPAVAPGTLTIAIRCPATFRPTVAALAEGGLFSAAPEPEAPSDRLVAEYGPLAEALPAAVLARKNILVGGATGSGKTTLAAALINCIPVDERLTTIEDTDEWSGLPHRNRVALYYSKGDQGVSRVTAGDLLVASLRLRPDRVLMQELRDGAAFFYVRAVVAGHPGSITTLHAGSAKGAFDALRLMIRQDEAGGRLSDADIRDILTTHIDVVVHLEHRAGRRRVSDVYWKEQGDALAA